MTTRAREAPAVQVAVEAVPEGMIVDFLTDRQVRDTAEEYVRQNIERALVQQYGFTKGDCEPEFPIKVGSSRKRVDIIVFDEAASHTQESAYILVETKRPGTSPSDKREGIEQLKSYMAACLNARYGLWTNGDDRFCFAKRVAKDGLEFEEIIEIPAAGQTEAEAQRPRRKDLKPATADNLLFAFRRCHNYIAGTEGMQKPDAFWELLKLIFCKIEDERSKTLSFFVTPTELTSATAAGPAKTRIQKIFTDVVVRKYPTIFSTPETQRIQLKSNVVAYVVSQLQSYSLLRSPVDVKGVAYEEVVGSNLRGDRGEFFTPRNACRMAVTMINPQPGERLLDPACGTGGFLITAMNHALDHLERSEKLEWDNVSSPSDLEREELYRKRADYLGSSVFGLDLNPNLVRAAKMNMVMNNDGAGGLFQANSLGNPHTWSPDAATAIPLGSIDVLFTNPPFGANILIDDRQLLAQYELAARWDEVEPGRWEIRIDNHGRNVLQRSQPPEILFIERCVQLLKPGTGRMAIVLPNGILNNPALGYVRQWILENTQVLAVVDMARELFQPKNDTQTSMVLLRRLSLEEATQAKADQLDYPTFMAVAEKVGHDRRGNAVYKLSPTGEELVAVRKEFVQIADPDSETDAYREIEVREPIIDDDLPEVATAYRRWLGQAAQ
ncbi:MAG: N-6 DNA methylase [Gaiellaceae bacterium]